MEAGRTLEILAAHHIGKGDASTMPHPLVDQLRFARFEWMRSLAGVDDDDARRRLGTMNCISWMIGHLADGEQNMFLKRQGEPLAVPELNAICGFGNPASTPPLNEMWTAWHEVTRATDPVLDAFTSDDLLALPAVTTSSSDSNGTMLLRVIGHYWFHNGEAQAVRQLLGHQNLPDFVGDMGAMAPYRSA
jgi:hypothetical protein